MAALKLGRILLSSLSLHSRAFSSSARTLSQRGLVLRRLRRDWGNGIATSSNTDSDYGNREVSTKKLLDTFRDLQAERLLSNKGGSKAWFREARRTISELLPVRLDDKPSLTIGEMERVLADENGQAWQAIRDLGDYGCIPRLDNLSEERKAAILFTRIHGVGKEYAEYFAAAGCRTLDDIAGATKIDRRSVTEGMKLSIRYLDDLELMIPRAELDEHVAKIGTALQDTPGMAFEVMGSYRRGEAVSSDIDMVVWHKGYTELEDDSQALLGKAFDVLVKHKILDEDKVLTGLGGSSKKRRQSDPRRLIALTRLRPDTPMRQIDIRLCPTKSLPYMLLGNTGDDLLMKILRNRAKERGWMLNEYGMGKKARASGGLHDGPADAGHFLKGSEMPASSEEEIFAALGVPYLKPTERSYHAYASVLGRDL